MFSLAWRATQDFLVCMWHHKKLKYEIKRSFGVYRHELKDSLKYMFPSFSAVTKNRTVWISEFLAVGGINVAAHNVVRHIKTLIHIAYIFKVWTTNCYESCLCECLLVQERKEIISWFSRCSRFSDRHVCHPQKDTDISSPNLTL